MFLAGIVLGAGAMTLLNRERGAVNRRRIRDKAEHFLKVGKRETQKTAKRYWKSASGLIQEKRARMQEGKIPDEILEERVKAQIGHVLSHRGVIVRARDGHVIVDGMVEPGEKQKLADRLGATRGVRSFDLLVEEQNDEERFPIIHGGSRARRNADAA
jgi:hypothetical protein